MIPSADIRAEALKSGFDAVGFTLAEVPGRDRLGLSNYMATSRFESMEWMARNPEKRSDPKRLWPAVKTVVVAGVNYAPEDCATTGRSISGMHGTRAISAYARNKDYHGILKKRLVKFARWLTERYGGETRVFVDTAPVLERALAARAGIGWQGKNTHLVSPRFGAWLFLGEIFTSLSIVPDSPARRRCGNCRRCMDACPAQAIETPFHLEVNRCIAYLTIEHKGAIPRSLRERIGTRIYGCDECLRACPWNRFSTPARDFAWNPRSGLLRPDLKRFLQFTDASFRDFFGGSPIKRTGVERFLRNVLVAAGNSGRKDLIDDAAALLHHPSEMVRATAVWALSRLLPHAELIKMSRKHATGEISDLVRREWRIACEQES